jgi:hypothetical protein
LNSGTATAEQRFGVDLARTRWSMLAAVRDGDEAGARDSLRELCRRYWVPVYAYVRRSGHAPEEASLLVQHFLSHLVDRLRVDQTDISRGFRVYLESHLAHFLGSEAARAALAAGVAAGAMKPPWPLEQIERRQRQEHPESVTPAEALRRAFALEMMAIALEQLRREAVESEHGELFEAVRPFLGREPTEAEYATLAGLMGSSQLAAVIAVKRLRQRFQELIDEELAQTVGDPRAVETERHTLLTLVLPAPGNEQR